MHIHIDPVGGIAGDMFVAAMLDLHPQFEAEMTDNLRCVQALSGVAVNASSCSDGVLAGKRIAVTGPALDGEHVSYTVLVDGLRASSLPPKVKDRACDILLRLAQAEADVHGVELQQVTLHEAGSPDSLADIVCSAFLITAANAASWSCGALPCGNGTVMTGHGELPLPAPAVVKLLAGCPVYNDGRQGERVTPTGAAILRSLEPQFDLRRSAMRLSGVGHGFGSASFPGMSNIVRLIAFADARRVGRDEKIGVISFEVDDQSPEDLSTGLDNVRANHGVLDVVQIPALGKKGRFSVHVQVLVQLACVDAVAAQCALETATLGVRIQTVDRLVLERDNLEYRQQDGTSMAIKLATRPDGNQTAKVAADQLTKAGDYRQRKAMRQAAEMEIERNTQSMRDRDENG